MIGALISVSGVAFAQPAPSEAADLGEIVVLGRGQPRQVQSVSGSELLTETPGASPLKAIAKLPGVFFTGADPFGSYEYAATLNLRGFSQTQLGFTLDGVPLGDMSYSNHNGLHISRALISENVSRAQLAQGASDLDAASTSNLGGTLKFFSRDPAETLGADFALSVGDDQHRRFFGRVDTGAFGPTRARASLSYADSATNVWTANVGEQTSRQLNAKIVQPLGSNHDVALWVNASQRRENDYLEHSRAQIARLGYFSSYLAPNYALAIQIADVANNIDEDGDGFSDWTGAAPINPAAGTQFPGAFETPDDAYFQGSGLRDDVIGALTWNGRMSKNVRASVTAYSHTNKGQGPWFTPYVSSPNAYDPDATSDNAPIAFRGFSYDFTRWGGLGSIEIEAGRHRLQAGAWYETNASREGFRYFGLDRARPNRDSLKFQEDPFYVDDFFSFDTETTKIYAQDTWRPSDALTVLFGFKGQRVTSKATKEIEDNVRVRSGDAGYTFGEISAEDWFLPQVGFVYRLNPSNEVFGSAGESLAAFASQSGGVNANGSQAAIDDAVATIEPERSRTFELGWRWRGERFEALAAIYRVQFENRLAVFFASDSPILVSEAIYRNVGSVETNGIEASLRAQFTDAVSGLVSLSYNKSRYQDDVLRDDGALEIATKGKTVAGAPEKLAKADLTYDDGALFGGVSYSYSGEWFYTYENDNPVQSVSLVDLHLGYRFTKGIAKGAEISLVASNVFDERYISAWSGLVERDPDGDQQVLFVGGPRTTYVTLRKKF
ncbi:MAG: TonB-dependent receptor [Caulobacterales bacterium]